MECNYKPQYPALRHSPDAFRNGARIAVWIHSEMAREIEKTIYCAGCGEDITAFRVKRFLSSEISKDARDVKLLWHSLFDKELVERGYEEQACNLVNGDTGKMCRRCFNSFIRCSKLLKSIRKDVSKAVKVFLDNGSLNSARTDALIPNASSFGSQPSTPAPKRCRLTIATSSDSECPDVVVNINIHRMCYFSTKNHACMCQNVLCMHG